MRKYISYILILIALMGIFSPTLINAQAKAGDPCNNGKNTLIVAPKGGELTCQGPAPKTTPPATPVTQTSGTCWDPFLKGFVNYTKSQCLTASLEWKDANTNVNTSYTLLAPLPGLEAPLDVAGKTALGKYLNIMITLIIGIAAVLAMVMIVMGGIQYMTTELISSKEEGKKRITNAIFGLLLALGSYLLLNTINPDLLKTDIKIEEAKVEVLLQEVIRSDTGNPPGGATARCSAGIQKTTIGMFACGDILQNINNMLAATKNAGLNMTGGGFRSEDQQKELRIKNCKGDFINPNAPCTPDTAIPGESNHQHGKAFDLQCDGEPIQAKDNKCFNWLQANARTYGLSNYPPEPWHWSVDGR